MLRIIFLAWFATSCTAGDVGCPTVAYVSITGTTQFPRLKGQLTLTQASRIAPVMIQGEIEGLPPGEHGFHVHETGNIGNDCGAAGPHFNPFVSRHGSPYDSTRHVGDLGNVQAISVDGREGVVKVYIEDDIISLCEKRSVIGRAIVIHAKTDDFGRGGDEESAKTGNAGMRAGCGVIAVNRRASSDYGNPSYGNPAYGNPSYENPSYGNPAYGNTEIGDPRFGDPTW